MRTLIQTSFITVFYLMMIVPGVGLFIGLGRDSQVNENRSLASMPKLPQSPKQISKFFAGCDAYVKDHIGFRKLLIETYARLCVHAMGKSPKQQVILGKDEWLYYAGEGTEFEKYEKPFTCSELQTIKNAIETRKRLYSRNGALFLMMIAPDKQSVYPEHLPDHQANWMNIHTPYDQVYQYIKEKSTEDMLIDVKSEVLQEKNSGQQVFFKTDSHWNDYAGMIVYRSIIDRIARHKPGVVGLDMSNHQWIRKSFSGDLVNMIGCDQLFVEESEFIVPPLSKEWKAIKEVARNSFRGTPINTFVTSTKMPTGLPMKAVVICDSQFNHIRPLFSETFSEVVYLHWAENTKSINQIIEKEKPEIVIYEVVERSMPFSIVRDISKIEEQEKKLAKTVNHQRQ